MPISLLLHADLSLSIFLIFFLFSRCFYTFSSVPSFIESSDKEQLKAYLICKRNSGRTNFLICSIWAPKCRCSVIRPHISCLLEFFVCLFVCLFLFSSSCYEEIRDGDHLGSSAVVLFFIIFQFTSCLLLFWH